MKFPMVERLLQAGKVLVKGMDPQAFLQGFDLNETTQTVHHPFARSVWVQRAIKKVAGPIAAVPLEFTTDGETEVESPELSAFWQNPAVGMDLAEFIETSVTWRKLAGESFWILDDLSLVPYPEARGKLSPLILARPDRMREICSQGKLIGWEYRDAANTTWPLLPEQVIQWKNPNPYNEYRGLSEYEAARIATEADYAAGQFNRNLSQNNGDQGVYVVAKGGMPDDAQREMITNQLRMKRAMQQRGQFRPAFIAGDVEIQDPKIQAPDGDFWAGRLANRHEIFIAFGVPPSMADKMESYSIGSASDWYVLIFETCIPTSVSLAGQINKVVAKQTGQSVQARWDWDEHPVMQSVRRERLDSAEKLWTKGMPMSEINDYLALGLKPYTGWDKGYLAFSVAPVEGAPAPKNPKGPEFSDTSPGGEATGGGDKSGDAFNQLARLLQAGVKQETGDQGGEVFTGGNRENRAPGGAATGGIDQSLLTSSPTLIKDFEVCCGGHVKAGGEKTTDSRTPHEKAHWRGLMQKRLPTIRAYESKVTRLLFDARAEVLEKLHTVELKMIKGILAGSPVTKSAAADFMFDLSDFTTRFVADMRGVGMTALETAGGQFFEEIAKNDPFKMPPVDALKFLDTRQNQMSGVPQDVFKSVMDTLTEGLNEGESIKELSERVRGEFNAMAKERATTIAMTETAAAYGTARQTAMKQAGIQFKKWLTSGNDNVRVAHRMMNGATVPIDAPFVVINPKTGSVDHVQHPSDPEGEPWNVINCHCVSLAKAEGPKQTEGAE